MTVVQRQTPNSEQPNLTTSSMKFFHCCSYNGVSAELRAISGGGARVAVKSERTAPRLKSKPQPTRGVSARRRPLGLRIAPIGRQCLRCFCNCLGTDLSCQSSQRMFPMPTTTDFGDVLVIGSARDRFVNQDPQPRSKSRT